jgi:hypothetical protein
MLAGKKILQKHFAFIILDKLQKNFGGIMRSRIRIISLIVSVFLASSLLALGISIEPGGALMVVQKFGVAAPGTPLKIINVNDSPMIYMINVLNGESRIKGYSPIPDTTWVRPEKDSFVVQPHETLSVPMIVDIPPGEENYNRAWSCELMVTQISTQTPVPGATAVMELGAHAVWLIETPSREVLPAKNKTDLLSVSPALWIVQYGDSTINNGEFPFQIRNDDNVKHTYSFQTYMPYYGDSIRGQRLDIMPITVDQNGWILDSTWITAKKTGFLFFKGSPKFTLKPGEIKEHIINLNLPLSKELGNKQYEGVILIKRDGETKGSRFIRFLIAPGLKYNPSEKG